MAEAQHIFLFDMTRTRSNLTLRYLSTHPSVEQLWHPYSSAWFFGPEKFNKHIAAEQKEVNAQWIPPDDKAKVTYAEARQAHSDAVEASHAKGKILIAKEHCQIVMKQETTLASILDMSNIPFNLSNPTDIPDKLLAILTPVFIIRHPVFSITSNYKGFGGAVELGSPRWRCLTEISLQRRLFEFFSQKLTHPPIVVDGDDVVWRSADVGEKLCKQIGIDATLSETWKPKPLEERHHLEAVRQLLSTSDDSTGIIRQTKRPVTDIEKTRIMWLEGFGEKVAGELSATLERSLPHYEYMAQFKI